MKRAPVPRRSEKRAKRYVGPVEAAKILRVSRVAVWKMARSGKLVSAIEGRNWFKVSDVERLARQRRKRRKS